MAIFYQYDLPDAITPAGTFHVRLWSTLSGLTIPTKNLFLSIGDAVEVDDESAGVQSIQSLRVVLGDDYSTYAEGFWHKVLAVTQTVKIRFFLVENGADTFYFYGTKQTGKVNWNDHAINEPTYRRAASVDLISAAAILFNPDILTVAALTTEWWDYRTLTGNAQPTDYYSGLALKDIFACMLSASGLNATFASSDAVFIWDGTNADFQFLQGGIWYRFDQLYIPIEKYDTGDPSPQKTYYISQGARVGSPYYLANIYSDCKSLVADILRNFGLTMQMSYSIDAGQPEGGRHIIELRQRKRAYATGIVWSAVTPPNRIKQASEADASNFLIDAVRASFLNDNTQFVWASKRYLGDGTVWNSVASPFANVNFDIDYKCPFAVRAQVTKLDTWVLRAGATLGGAGIVTGVKYYNYYSNAYETMAPSFTNLGLEEAGAKYLYYLFTRPRKAVNREYGVMAPTLSDGSQTSHTILNAGRQMTIDDGSGAATYYANKITKRTMQAGASVEWIQ